MHVLKQCFSFEMRAKDLNFSGAEEDFEERKLTLLKSAGREYQE